MSKYATYRRGRRIRKFLANLFLGLFVIAVGVGYLGNHIEALPWSGFTLFIPGWGALFLIIPAIYNLIRNPFSWFWPICLLAGALILLTKLEIYPFKTALAIGLSVLVILVGIRIIFSPVFKRLNRHKIERTVFDAMDASGIGDWDGDISFDEENGKYEVNFGSRTVALHNRDFSAATLDVSFGELIFDLTRANVTNCAVIDANCSFGDLVIKLPDSVRVEVNRDGAFSRISWKHKDPKDENAPVVYINADCSFGNIKIK